MAKILSLKGAVVGEIKLPKVFMTEHRPDLIQRAVVSEQSEKRQPYASSIGAGLDSSADYFGRRKGAYRMTVNRGMSRLPREKTPNGGLGRVRLIPSSVGGHRAHPPKGKDYAKRMNNKEYDLALKSAIAATTSKEFAEMRGHAVAEIKSLPLIVEDVFEKASKTKEIIEALTALGIGLDMERAEKKTIRAGRGKNRGRRYRKKKGALIVVGKDAGIVKGARNIPGIDVVSVSELKVELLAPGTQSGRLTVWTKSAIENIDSAFN